MPGNLLWEDLSYILAHPKLCNSFFFVLTWNLIKKNMLPSHYNKRPRLTHVLISSILLITTVIVALTVPFFGYLMSLVGALLSVSASFLVPCVFYLKISGTYRKLGCEMIINYSIILISSAIATFRTYTSLLEIIRHLKA